MRLSPRRHSSESWNLGDEVERASDCWILRTPDCMALLWPYYGLTIVIPAKREWNDFNHWIPACAGMTAGWMPAPRSQHTFPFDQSRQPPRATRCVYFSIVIPAQAGIQEGGAGILSRYPFSRRCQGQPVRDTATPAATCARLACGRQARFTPVSHSPGLKRQPSPMPRSAVYPFQRTPARVVFYMQ